MKTKYSTSWTEEDFDSLSWHENKVRGIRFSNPSESYDFDLTFDIDHVLRWMKTPSEHIGTVIAPASLVFHTVDRLRIAIEMAYKEHLTILEISRKDAGTESEKKAGLKKWLWQIDLICLSGGVNTISFESSGFTQRLTKEPAVTFGCSLDEESNLKTTP